MIARITLWLRRRRQQRLRAEAQQLEELARKAHRYAPYNRFIASLLAFRRRRGYLTSKQHAWLRVAVRRQYLVGQGA